MLFCGKGCGGTCTADLDPFPYLDLDFCMLVWFLPGHLKTYNDEV